MVAIVETDLSSPNMYDFDLTRTPRYLKVCLIPIICSIAVLAATNPDPLVAFSKVSCLRYCVEEVPDLYPKHISHTQNSLEWACPMTRFYQWFRLCYCGTKPQHSKNHHSVMTSSWEPQCHHDIIMRTPRIMGKPRFSCSMGSKAPLTKIPLL